MDFATVLQLLAALGLGSVVGQYFAGRSDRRKARAEVLTALRMCEAARWVSAESGTGQVPFRRAAREFETAAVIAGLPQAAVRVYLAVADAATQESEVSFIQSGGDEEAGGGINVHHAEVAREVSRMVASLAWHPWRSRWRLRRRLTGLMNAAHGMPEFNRYLEVAEKVHP